ncbi:MAG: Methyltransferase type 11 [Microgenomates group bacterium GW2011_GWC1_37_8]|uniref:Methyltransferase type 11 n=1 Tax=Candidatus Woesebacteria bacterium GW2011_GWB1_38_8 TaxID=1618570 RepID=A0A0G0L557_9BACT|nr:MAG: Methyltransferase type 11 [Microgenomates group bacterium GW2011_GWC1_37_8]KKQ86147.1 MAG: Methyltransferase type 11 [Candidatus Woesebacteria bacterium GW2011_GWB1_38_8]
MARNDTFLINELNIDKDTKVLDIGGAMKQHEQIKVDTLVDIIFPQEAPYTASKLKAKRFVKVDITKEKLPFKNKEFDVCLCTHTLEDLYNPFLVIEEMNRVAKRGYIATPSMGTDMIFSHFDITDWLTGGRRVPGQSHHKWFFVKDGKKMKIIPKNYAILYSPKFHMVEWKGEVELEYYWKDKIEYYAVSDLNIHDLINEYQNFIKENRSYIRFGRVLYYYDNPFYVTKALLKLLIKRGVGYKFRKR